MQEYLNQRISKLIADSKNELKQFTLRKTLVKRSLCESEEFINEVRKLKEAMRSDHSPKILHKIVDIGKFISFFNSFKSEKGEDEEVFNFFKKREKKTALEKIEI